MTAGVAPGRRGEPRPVLANVFERFRVRSSSQQDLPFIDGFRGIAVAMVVVLHMTPTSLVIHWPLVGGSFAFGKYTFMGGNGVTLFFVLSGFLLSQAWFNADAAGRPYPDLRRYFYRRFMRIAPAYYGFLIFMVIFLVPSLIAPEAIYSLEGIKALVLHFSFMQLFTPATYHSFNVAPQFWTLTNEACFYILLPFGIYAFLRNRWLVSLPLVFLFAYIWKDTALHHGMFGLVDLTSRHMHGATPAVSEVEARLFLALQLPATMPAFCCGVALSNVYVHSKQPGSHWYAHPAAAAGYFLTGLAILTLVTFDWQSKPATLTRWGDLVVASGLVLVVAGAVLGAPAVRGLLSFAPLRWLGTISYSVYIWHFALLLIVLHYPGVLAKQQPDQFLYIAWHAVPMMLVVGTLSYLLVERPFLLISRGNRPPPPVPPAQGRDVPGTEDGTQQRPPSRAQRRRSLQPTS